MDDAIQDAQAQEKVTTIEAVKVVKDTFDSGTGLSKETIVYKSLGVPSSGAVPSGGGASHSAPSRSSGGGGRSSARSKAEPDWDDADNDDEDIPEEDDDDFDDEDYKPKKKNKAPKPKDPGRRGLGGFTKLALITFFSIGLAAILTATGTLFLKTNKLFGMTLTGDIRANILFGIFVVSFLFSIIPLSRMFITMHDFAAGSKKIKPRKAAPPRPTKVAQAVVTPRLEDLPPLEIPEPEPEEEEEPEAEPEEEEEEAKPTLSPVLEQQRGVMMQFLAESLQIVQSNKTPLTAMSKFGINMFLAGACEAQAQKNGLDGADTQLVLSESVQVIGFSKEQADGFAEKADAYLLADPSYMQMYEAGRNAMNTSMEGDPSGSKSLNQALVEWNKPKEKTTKTGTIAVMFTDMVGSTALTQAKGDAGAQHVVRAHNKIVRDALQRFQGKEIKHTGDGIMCSFTQTSNAVEAASEIMRNTRTYTAATPDFPLHLKIGINAGEPIAEDDDLFGTTVQLSARIVDKAQSGQIFVSEIVRGICAGKPIQFASAGGFAMKGFAEPVPLHEVIWDDDAPASAGAAPAEAVQSKAS